MKVEYINPFIEASQSIIVQTSGLKTSLGKLRVKNSPYKGDSVVVLIGLTGEIKGNVVISLAKSLACKIASAMMCGMPVPELDELAKSAIAEMCNMILGHTANLFSINGMNIDITPPTVLTGENMEFSPSKTVIVCVPLMFEDGEVLEIDVSYQES
ncbi:MAG: chemotaxis protein CheX [Bacillota bacterium]|nr:chemotaxis protein CheX [Bacillota bacterium]